MLLLRTPAHRLVLFIGLCGAAVCIDAVPVASDPPEDLGEIKSQAMVLFTSRSKMRSDALKLMRERGNPDVIAALIYALRYTPDPNSDLTAVLQTLSGETIGQNWGQWLLWQQAHPEIKPFPDFAEFQATASILVLTCFFIPI